ncbi:uncharacterized protein LOC129619359 isoform X2 [Condylostylus longicornis]|uniref:uncharacterized protein LOC129619359 isoform X2 n=1 Tax=Condylostylus longicornis TaxID=2530218 RepID=UPI00244DACDD|nr:uncharacterized protein LOC129619359 isoform X2 [Condylostylus longicornis]
MSLELKVNKLEQNKMKKCVDVVGLPNVNSNIVKEKVLSLFSQMCNENLSESDITNCYIKHNNVNKNKSNKNIIFVKFSSMNCKQKIMNCKKFLKTKNFGVSGEANSDFVNKKVYVNNSLTLFYKSLLKKAQEIKKERSYKFLWIRNSTIYMRKIEGSDRLEITCFEDLNRISNIISYNKVKVFGFASKHKKFKDLLFISEIWIFDWEVDDFSIPSYSFNAACNSLYSAAGVCKKRNEEIYYQ